MIVTTIQPTAPVHVEVGGCPLEHVFEGDCLPVVTNGSRCGILFSSPINAQGCFGP